MNEIVCQFSIERARLSSSGPREAASSSLIRSPGSSSVSSVSPRTQVHKAVLGEMVLAQNQAGEGPGCLGAGLMPWPRPAFGSSITCCRPRMIPRARVRNMARRAFASRDFALSTLEIVVDEQSADPREPFVSIPWNLVYDERPAKHKPAFQTGKTTERWRPFWSIRYNLTSGLCVEPLKRMPTWSR